MHQEKQSRCKDWPQSIYIRSKVWFRLWKVEDHNILLRYFLACIWFLPVLPNMKDSLESSPLWVTITILYIRPCSKFWKEKLWTWGSTCALSWRVRSGLYRKMLYQLSSPSEAVQLKDRCLVEFSVILRLVTAAGTEKVKGRRVSFGLAPLRTDT